MKSKSNILYDYIIVGGSRDGLEIFEFLLNNKVQVLLIDDKGKNINNSEYSHKTKGIYFNYRRGIIYVETAFNGCLETFCCKNLIIATGETFKTLDVLEKPYLITNNVFYGDKHISQISTTNCAILGDSTAALKAAIELSNSCKTVYLCKPKFNSGSKTLLKEIANRPNIKVFNGDTVVDFKYKKEFANVIKITDLKLFSYSEIPCDTVVVFTEKCPDTSNFSTRLIKLDELKYCEVDENYCSTIVPNVYAIGRIVKGYKRLKFLKVLREKIKAINKNNG